MVLQLARLSEVLLRWQQEAAAVATDCAEANMNNLIAVETDMFEHREAKPHFINPCCFGEDSPPG